MAAKVQVEQSQNPQDWDCCHRRLVEAPERLPLPRRSRRRANKTPSGANSHRLGEYFILTFSTHAEISLKNALKYYEIIFQTQSTTAATTTTGIEFKLGAILKRNEKKI
jgi:hypothetical protein